MNYNPYLYDKLAQSHHQELYHEAEQERLLAQLPQRHPQLVWKGVARLGTFLTGHFSSAAKVEQPARTATGQL